MTRRTIGGLLVGGALVASCAPPPGQRFSGLSADVEILIDRHGIPHVYGETDLDVLFGSGYIMAADRLFQMDLVRRRALGRLSEVFGAAKQQDDELSRVLGFGRLGADQATWLADEDPAAHALLEAWIEGVNAQIEKVRAGERPLPYGFGPDELDYLPERWAIADVLAIEKLFSFSLDGQNLQAEILASLLERYWPQLVAVLPLIQPAFPAFCVPPEERPSTSRSTRAARAGLMARTLPRSSAPRPDPPAWQRMFALLRPFVRGGCNNWAVDGRLSANGRPLIANDLQGPLESPPDTYLLHLNSRDGRGSYDAIGVSIVGTPMVHIGHNRRVFWSGTANMADVVDLWDVAATDGGSEVRIGDRTRRTFAHRERIVVRREAGPAGSGDTVEIVVHEVPGVGVLLPPELFPLPLSGHGRRVLLNWIGFQRSNDVAAIWRMGLAGSVGVFERAVDELQTVATTNWVAADAQGISYRMRSLIPDRGDPLVTAPAWHMRDGDDPGTFGERGYLPADRLPAGRAPLQGFLVTANNDPWGFTENGRVDDDPWYHGAFYAPGFRAQRIESDLAQLAQRGGMTVEEMQRLQMDTHSLLAEHLLPLLGAAWKRAGREELLAPFRERDDLGELVSLLTTQWNGRMDRSEAGAVAFHAWLHFLIELTYRDEAGPLIDIVLEIQPVFLTKLLFLALVGPPAAGRAVIDDDPDLLLLRALDQTATWLTTRFGAASPGHYVWSDFHGAQFSNAFGEELGAGFVPMDGGEDTVSVASGPFFEEGDVAEKIRVRHGPHHRFVASFAEDGTPQALFNFAPGNSGDPMDPHFRDGVESWQQGEYHPLPFRRHEVSAVTERTVVLAKSQHRRLLH